MFCANCLLRQQFAQKIQAYFLGKEIYFKILSANIFTSMLSIHALCKSKDQLTLVHLLSLIMSFAFHQKNIQYLTNNFRNEYYIQPYLLTYPVSAQSRNFVILRLQPMFFYLYFFIKAYVVSTRLNCIGNF